MPARWGWDVGVWDYLPVDRQTGSGWDVDPNTYAPPAPTPGVLVRSQGGRLTRRDDKMTERVQGGRMTRREGQP